MDTQKNGVLSKLNTWYVLFLGGWGSIKAAGERKNFCDNNMNLISRKQKTRINTVWHCVQNKPGGLLRGTLECGPPYFFGISESKPAFSNGSACSRNQPAPLIIPNFAWNIFSGLRLLSCKPLQGWQKKQRRNGTTIFCWGFLYSHHRAACQSLSEAILPIVSSRVSMPNQWHTPKHLPLHDQTHELPQFAYRLHSSAHRKHLLDHEGLTSAHMFASARRWHGIFWINI